MSTRCEQELCPSWTGHGCACEVLDIELGVIGPSGEVEAGVDLDLTRLRTEIRAVLHGCPDGDGDLVAGVETLGRIRDRVAALLARCAEKEADTVNRRTHGGGLLPAILTTGEVRALLGAATPEQ